MCGRYTLIAGEEDIRREFGVESPISQYQPSYNVAPGQDVLAIIQDGQEKRAGYLRWGLVPSWAKDEKVGYKMINARSETAHEKPSFKKIMSRKRCLLVADGFYEWKETDNIKQPIRIQLAKRPLFAFAGLWDKWQQDDKVLFTCTILTKDANHFMRDVHHRMPIILPKDKEEEWINPNVQKPIEMYRFLQSVHPEEMTAYPVGTHVNAAKNNDPTCMERIVD